MSDSDSSRLSSPPATDDEMAPPVEVIAPVKAKLKSKKRKQNGTILSFFEPPSPARKKRPASPPHEMVPEDNPDIAVSRRRVHRVVARPYRAHFPP
jgi:hypothetical protein